MPKVMYVGPSPSRDVPGVGVMARGEGVEVSKETAERLLASSSFAEAGGQAKPEPTGGEEG